MLVFLEFHVYQGSNSDWFYNLKYTSSCIRVDVMDCRGLVEKSQDVGRINDIDIKDHIVRGLQDGECKLFYRNIFLDPVLLKIIIMKMDFIDKHKLNFAGFDERLLQAAILGVDEGIGSTSNIKG